MVWQKIVCIIIGYGFGLFQTSYLIGKAMHIDIREHGSGNAGTTNALRTLGMKYGLMTFVGDMLKAILAVVLTHFLFKPSIPDHLFVIALYTGIGVVLGHNYPFYMNFKGGKGVAATGGVILSLCMFDPKFTYIGLIVFFGITLITRYVSLGSILLVTTFFIEVVVFGQLGWIKNFNYGDKIEVYILTFIFFAFTVIRHKENIQRLINGTERKLGEKKEA